MKILVLWFCLVNFIDFCVTDKHTYGKQEHSQGERVALSRETVLIDSNTTEPRIYSIKFKHFGSFADTVTYLEFDIDSPSTGSIESSRSSVRDPTYNEFLNIDYPTINVHGTITIHATLHCKATLKIYERSMYSTPLRIDFLNVKKSLTLVHSKNASSPPRKRFVQHAIGKRENGDKLIHFKSRNVTNSSRFPSRSFEYSDGEYYITYVGFSFNSPTAMVLLNSTFISEKEFNAIVYDMNTEHFVANVSVYGIKSKPEKGYGVIGSI